MLWWCCAYKNNFCLFLFMMFTIFKIERKTFYRMPFFRPFPSQYLSFLSPLPPGANSRLRSYLVKPGVVSVDRLLFDLLANCITALPKYLYVCFCIKCTNTQLYHFISTCTVKIWIFLSVCPVLSPPVCPLFKTKSYSSIMQILFLFAESVIMYAKHFYYYSLLALAP